MTVPVGRRNGLLRVEIIIGEQKVRSTIENKVATIALFGLSTASMYDWNVLFKNMTTPMNNPFSFAFFL